MTNRLGADNDPKSKTAKTALGWAAFEDSSYHKLPSVQLLPLMTRTLKHARKPDKGENKKTRIPKP